MAQHSLQVDSIIKLFADKKVLSDIYLSCSTAEIVGIFGRNGSGKSTLMKIIFGIENAANKFIKVDDTFMNQSFTRDGGIGYLPQNNFVPKSLTVEKAILLFIDDDKTNSIINDAVIKNFRKKKVKVLSLGELRYLEIMLILFSENKFAILDEPFRGLSPILIDRTKQMIFKQSATKGIIISDHDYENVIDIATKSYILHEGKLSIMTHRQQLTDLGYLPRFNVSNL